MAGKDTSTLQTAELALIVSIDAIFTYTYHIYWKQPNLSAMQLYIVWNTAYLSAWLEEMEPFKAEPP